VGRITTGLELNERRPSELIEVNISDQIRSRNRSELISRLFFRREPGDRFQTEYDQSLTAAGGDGA
jgi:hypothetical protein